jgi:hypothetical protein
MMLVLYLQSGGGKATHDELALGSFTRRKLKHLPIWDL